MCGLESLLWIFPVIATRSSPLTGVQMAREWEVEDETRLCAYGGIDEFHISSIHLEPPPTVYFLARTL